MISAKNSKEAQFIQWQLSRVNAALKDAESFISIIKNYYINIEKELNSADTLNVSKYNNTLLECINLFANINEMLAMLQISKNNELNTESQLTCHNYEENSSTSKSDTKSVTTNCNDSSHEGSSTMGIQISVEHVQSPSEFYVLYKNTEYKLFDDLKEKLKSIPVDVKEITLKQTLKNKISLSKKIKENVIYYSICDEAWYRAQVVDWCLQYDDDLVLVFIIDTGETKTVSISYLKPLPRDLENYPTFLLKCHLCDIKPFDCKYDVNNEKSMWMKNATEKMRFWIEVSDKVSMKISSTHESNLESLPVTLWLSGNETSVNELLVEFGLAQWDHERMKSEIQTESESSQDIEAMALDKWNPMKEDFQSNSNKPDVNVLDPAYAIYGYIGRDDRRVCRHFAETGRCYKGKACRKEHERSNPLGFTTDRENIFINAINSFQALVNEMLTVEITNFLDVNTFYCILTHSRAHDEETLWDLNDFMNKPVNVRNMKKLSVPPSIGQIVIARYSEDNGWYRGRVLESEPESDRYTVLYVDYGNQETVTLSRIRAIEPQYLHLPFQGLRCTISGLEKTKDPILAEEGFKYLNNLIKEQTFIIKIVNIHPGYLDFLSVNLYDDTGNDIGKKLVEKGYALSENFIVSNDSEIVPG